jgi:hypothetical protein
MEGKGVGGRAPFLGLVAAIIIKVGRQKSAMGVANEWRRSGEGEEQLGTGWLWFYPILASRLDSSVIGAYKRNAIFVGSNSTKRGLMRRDCEYVSRLIDFKDFLL